MKFRKRLLLLSVLSISCINAQAAMYKSHSDIDLSHHRFTLGTSWTNFATSSFWLNIGGVSDTFVWRLAAASTLFRNQIAGGAADDSFNAICGTLHLGLRKPLGTTYALEYGFAGGLLTFNGRQPSVSDQYSLGGFVGLDAFVNDHVMLFASVQPYAYRRNNNETVQHQIFEQGTLGVSYVF